MQTDTSVTIFFYLKKHRGLYFAGVLFLATFYFAVNRVHITTKRMIDEIFTSTMNNAHIFDPAKNILIRMVLFALLAFFARLGSRRYIFSAGRQTEYLLRNKLLAKLHELGSPFFQKISMGDILTRATQDITQVRIMFGFGILNLFNVTFALIASLQVMLAISWKLTLVSLSFLPLVVLITRFFSKRMYAGMRKTQQALGKLSDFVQNRIQGIRVIKAFGIEALEDKKFAAANEQYQKTNLELAKIRGFFMPIAALISSLGNLLFFAYGSRLLLRGDLTMGGFFAFWQALAQMTWPMISMGFFISVLQRGRASFSRLKEVFDEKPLISGGQKKLSSNPIRIEVRNLNFSYGDRAVLKDINFDLHPGESLAIVGRTGSGKTTLARLLAGFEKAPIGTIFIQGIDICDLDLFSLRRTIGYAQQDAFLFSTSIAQNIAFPWMGQQVENLEKKILKAAENAQISYEINKMPEQFDTIVGERGIQLSGGQRQRIALARALLWDPSILILDDPLSAVDVKTEAAILSFLKQKSGTRLLITNRIQVALSCDRILVVDSGCIVGAGSHRDLLLNSDGLYAQMAQHQTWNESLDVLDFDQEGV